MKVIYEVDDREENKTSLNMHKYADDMFLALSNIDNLIKQEKTGATNLAKEKMLDFLEDEIFASKLNEIR